MRMARIIAAASAVVLAAACSPLVPGAPAEDAEISYAEASLEEPVTLLPGLYELRLGGGTLVELRSGTRTDRVCLDSYAAGRVPVDPLGATMEPWETCTDELDPPRGNAMSGARRCTQRRTPMIARYTGTHSADAFKVAGSVAQGTGENQQVMRLGSGDFSITGKRIGDCPA